MPSFLRTREISANARPFAAVGWLMFALIACVLQNVASAQDAWQTTPYRMYAAFVFDPSPEMTERARTTLLRDLHEQCDNTLGANWNLETAIVGPEWRMALGGNGESPNTDQLFQLILNLQEDRSAEGIVQPFDKVFLIHVSQPDGRLRLSVRELDVATRILGHEVTHLVPQTQVLAQATFDAILDAFRPLAKIEESDTDDIRLGLRAEGLPRRDPQLKFTQPGDLFMPVIRQNNRDGTPRGIRAVPWTYLRVNPPEPAETGDNSPTNARPSQESQPQTIVDTTLYTALQSAFTKRKRGREEKYALAVHAPFDQTTFRAVDRANPEAPLQGYEIISYTPDSPKTTRLGTTNPLGEIAIPVDQAPLHLLLVRSGARMLARLPIVPGAEQVAQIELADDRDRLQVEGYITGLQEEMVNVFTQRELLMRLIRTQLERNDKQEAQDIMTRLRKLPSAESFRQRIRSRRLSFSTTDPYVEQHVSKLFDDTEGVLDRFFRTDPIRELQQAIDAAPAN